MPEYTARKRTTRPRDLPPQACGTGPMRQSDARDFEPSYYTPIDRQGSGRVEPNDLKRIFFDVTLEY
jgi:hypothetical protein